MACLSGLAQSAYDETMIERRLILHLAAAMVALAPLAVVSAKPGDSPAGRYDGSQAEMAAALELGADGRFRYALSYGALDEMAEGSWTRSDGQILLTSDPVAAPRFEVVPGKAWARPKLVILLDVPQGMSRQYFTAHIAMGGDRTVTRQLGADGLTLPLGPKERALAVTMELELYGVRSAPLVLARGRGGEVHFRFVPNDLGKVAFAGERLRIEERALAFERHGRTIRFRRLGADD